MNNRRKLLVVLGAATFTPQAVFAQSKPPVLIGWLHVGSRTASGRSLQAFTEGMTALGIQVPNSILVQVTKVIE